MGLSVSVAPGAADVEKVEEKAAIDLTPIVVEDKGECRSGNALEGLGNQRPRVFSLPACSCVPPQVRGSLSVLVFGRQETGGPFCGSARPLCKERVAMAGMSYSVGASG